MQHFTQFFVVLLVTLFSLNVQAQCVPDSSVSGLYSPNFIDGLPDGQVGVQYEATITLNVPADTTYLTFTAVIDSLVLTDVTGLPPGFDYACVPPSCGFLGGSLGCVQISGITNDNADAVTWDIESSFDFYLKTPAVTLPYDLNEYSITIEEGAPAGINSTANSVQRMFIEPNPIQPTSQLVFDLPSSSDYSLDVYSLLGSRIAHTTNQGIRGENRFGIAEMVQEPGVYFITVHQGSYTRSMRFIVQ